MDVAAEELAALATLSEPQRARIYELLAAAEQPRSRQQIAEALGLGRTLVAFHLDKLEQAGLVRPAPGPAAAGRRGRPAQLYQVTEREVSATLPPRRYGLLAEILIEAAREQHPPEPLQEAAVRAAARRGHRLAAGQVSTGPAAEHTNPVRRLHDLLTRLGYEPARRDDDVLLTNCPFQRLRVLDTDLVCSINVALARGYLEGLGVADRFTARLRPCPGSCCVVLEPAA
jgi:predicted ArsR family transcriptional regulator